MNTDVMNGHANSPKCPVCGKEMRELPEWPGVRWCVDYLTPIRAGATGGHATVAYKCNGVWFKRGARG